uniref:Uncharacterized protein n=1 Tax=Anopheles melas TaxID=34690 RepID=A0A182UCD0_9DIPT
MRGSDINECTSNEFTCDDGRCIDQDRQCDGVADCSRGEDEQDCGIVECDESREFLCRSDNTCIQKEAVCDGNRDCSDGEDEICEACPRNTWQCDYGQCIPLEQKCDGNIDCPDDISDERNCPTQRDKCSIYEFQCRWDKRCIPIEKRCDKVYDCLDRTDEQVCGRCSEHEFHCNNGNCIPKDYMCNDIDDCGDNSDETDSVCGDYTCMPDEFTCYDGGCVSKTLVCDDRKDCEDGTDEMDCGKYGTGDDAVE